MIVIFPRKIVKFILIGISVLNILHWQRNQEKLKMKRNREIKFLLTDLIVTGW